MVKCIVTGLAVDTTSNSPVVLLSPENSGDTGMVLPIWIGPNETMVIGQEMAGFTPPRPLTHDLLLSIVITMGGTILKVEITELKDSTFYAKVHLSYDGKTVEVDARPSDAIALALKAKAPLLVNEELFRSQDMNPDTESGGQAVSSNQPNPESLADHIKRINPEDFGKYQL